MDPSQDELREAAAHAAEERQIRARQERRLAEHKKKLKDTLWRRIMTSKASQEANLNCVYALLKLCQQATACVRRPTHSVS